MYIIYEDSEENGTEVVCVVETAQLASRICQETMAREPNTRAWYDNVHHVSDIRELFDIES